VTVATGLPTPAQLRDRRLLDEQLRALDRTVGTCRDLGATLRSQASSVHGAWRSPAADQEVQRLRALADELTRIGGVVEGLRPTLVQAQGRLDAAEATLRRLRARAQAVHAAAAPVVAADERRGIDQQYRSMVVDVLEVEQHVNSAAWVTNGAAGIVLSAVSGAMRGTYIGAILSGSPTAGFVRRLVMPRLAALERSAWRGAAGARLVGPAHRVLDHLRAPRPAAYPGAPLTSLVRRTQTYLRAPILQTVSHRRIAAARASLAGRPQLDSWLGRAGRVGRATTRGIGVAGTVMTLASLPTSYAGARDAHLAQGRSAASARRMAVEDVGFRTAGEVVGAAAGAKTGAAIGATIGSFIAPGVGTVIGGAAGGAIGALAGSRVGGWAGDRLKDRYRSAKDTISSVGGSIASTAGSVTSAVGGGLSSVGSGVSSGLSSLRKRIF
jgi:hypothetical protein